MDPLRIFLKKVNQERIAKGNLLGLLHILVGRKICLADGSLVSSGMTWRELAALLKKVRWDPTQVIELGINPDSLPPRDRERYWYMVIGQAGIQSPQAFALGNQIQENLQAIGYIVSSQSGEGKP